MDDDRSSLPYRGRVDFVAKLHKRRGKARDSLVGPGGEVKLVDFSWSSLALHHSYYFLNNECDYIKHLIYRICMYVQVNAMYCTLFSTTNIRKQVISACCGRTFDNVNVRIMKSENGSAFSIDTTISSNVIDPSSGQY